MLLCIEHALTIFFNVNISDKKKHNGIITTQLPIDVGKLYSYMQMPANNNNPIFDCRETTNMETHSTKRITRKKKCIILYLYFFQSYSLDCTDES